MATLTTPWHPSQSPVEWPHGPAPQNVSAVQQSGDAHSLTFSCFRRQRFLDNDRTRQWFVDAMDTARRELAVDLWAYVIMPEHAHVLVRPRETEYDISDFLSAVKVPVTRKALTFVKKSAPRFLPRMLDVQPNGAKHHRFWQRGGGYDRNIVEPDTAWNEINYIHETRCGAAYASGPLSGGGRARPNSRGSSRGRCGSIGNR